MQLVSNRKPSELAAENEAVFTAWLDAFAAHGVRVTDKPVEGVDDSAVCCLGAAPALVLHAIE